MGECVVARVGAADGVAGNGDSFVATNILRVECSGDGRCIQVDNIAGFFTHERGRASDERGGGVGVVGLIGCGDTCNGEFFGSDVAGGGGLGQAVVARVGSCNSDASDGDGLCSADVLGSKSARS